MITRFTFQFPARLQGTEDLVPDEMFDYAMESNRRTIQILESLVNSIREQIPVDTSILPALSSGSSTDSTETIATSQDIQDAQAFANVINL